MTATPRQTGADGFPSRPKADLDAITVPPGVGEYAMDEETGKVRVGDGLTAWADLPYVLDTQIPTSLYDAAGAAAAAQAAALAVSARVVASGTGTLSSGAATVTNASVTANAVIRLAYGTRGGTAGAIFVSAISAGVNFTVTSTSNTDSGTFKYEIVSY